MHFLSDFETASQDILLKVGQEAVSKYGEKGAKSKVNHTEIGSLYLLLHCITPMKLRIGKKNLRILKKYYRLIQHIHRADDAHGQVLNHDVYSEPYPEI